MWIEIRGGLLLLVMDGWMKLTEAKADGSSN